VVFTMAFKPKFQKKVENAPYVHCAAHNLNLILNDAVKNLDRIFFLFC
jgi:hypothetical protein